MNTFDFVAVDFETATNNRMACQIGIAAVRDNEIVERFDSLIQPPYNKFDDATIRIHHIYPQDTMFAQPFDILWSQIKHYFIGQTVVAHNASFDEDVLRKNLTYYNIEISDIPTFECTCNIFGRLGLKDLCQKFNIECKDHHNASFDAECCALFYIKYLNNEYPENITFQSEKKKKFTVQREHLSGDVLVQDLTNADSANPFYDRKVVVTGEFKQERKKLGVLLKSMGADVNTSISKKTNYVLIGEDPGPAKLQKIEKLIHDGFHIRKLYQTDLDAIIAGNWEDYHASKTNEKSLDFTYKHYLEHKERFANGCNVIASRELYYGKGFKGDFDLFNQITGNLGAFGDLVIYPETNICVLSDETLDLLEKGEKDETILYIQNYYNSNKSIVFDFKFLSESDILDFCKSHCECCGDNLTMELYEKYIESAIKALQKKKCVFKPGKNYCKVDGKIVLKLDDGRTWCPSRQFRGDVYRITEGKEKPNLTDDEDDDDFDDTEMPKIK